MEPTLIQYMLTNVAMAIHNMQGELPGLELGALQLEEIKEKQKKARVRERGRNGGRDGGG